MRHLLLLPALAAAALPAAANELGTFYELGPRPAAVRWSAGAAVLSVPRYDGSSERRTLAVPALAVQLPNGFFAEPVNGVGLNLGRDVDLQYGVRLTVETGRSSDALRGFGRIDARLNPGAFANWRVAPRAELRAALRLGMAGGGTALHLGGAADVWRSGPHAVTAQASVRWADRDYNQAYFGVTPAQATASGLRPFSLDGGVNALQVGVGVRSQLSDRWTAFGGVAVQRLLGDAADSPVVRERSGARLLAGAAYRF